MKYNLNELNIRKKIIIDEPVYKDDFLDKRIIDLQNAHVTGEIVEDLTGEYIVKYHFIGTMIISDSITLEPVSYEFSTDFEEKLEEIKEIYQDCYDFSKNTLDLKTILWQNIVLEVPISYTKVRDAELKGNGWELINEHTKVDEIDPRLKKLEYLLKGDD